VAEAVLRGARASGFAPAKINLILHVRGRRSDGYHDLESLVSFAATGDHLTFDPDATPPLRLSGPMAPALARGRADEDADNLVIRAHAVLSRYLPDIPKGGFTLDKHLPIASGIGGGSADAAAALRLLADHARIAHTHPALLQAAGEIGADVPVCIAGRSRVMRGTGTELGPPLALPAFPALLVNPGIAIPTPAVFRGLALDPGQRFTPVGADDHALPSAPGDWPAPDDHAGWIERLASGRNDLAGPAEAIAPAIGALRETLSARPGCLIARMSGSGATVFALFADDAARDDAAAVLRARHPDYWIAATFIGGDGPDVQAGAATG
jgi:4-diphosphocytidyl-2-C-methyl-D-erythritol kinase